MDRIIVYSAQIPLSADFLNVQKNALRALGQLASDLMTSATATALIAGLACTPNSPAAMNVLLGPGSVYQTAQMDPTAYGSLAIDTNNVFQQGISLATQTLTGFSAPGTAGQSQNYLIQVQFAPLDGTLKLLNYFNSANPQVPLIGPNGSGTQQNTTRQGTISVQVVAGTPATTGAQTTPGVTAGWLPAYVVTIANGQSTIASGNIAVHASAPFLKSLTSQHHLGLPGSAPQIDLTQEVQGQLPLANVAPIALTDLTDLACSAGAGLTLNYNAGPVIVNGTPSALVAGTLTMTASATNYVYLNGAGAPTSNTTGWPTSGAFYPLAAVVTSASAITGVTDKRGFAQVVITSGSSRFRAYQATAQTGLAAASNKITFDTSVYDKLGEYSTTNSRFTATIAGNYLATASVLMNTISSAGTQLALDFYVNGAFHTRVYYEWTSAASTSPVPQGSAPLELAVGDYVEVYLYSGTSGLATQASAQSTYFAMTQIA